MPFSFTLGEYNVAGSFNTYFISNINAALPAWASVNFPIVFNWPDEPLQFPSFSVVHLGKFDEFIAEGDNVDPGKRGQKVTAVAEISCWQSAKDNFNWPRDLIQMRDMVVKLFSGARTMVIKDAYTTLVNPSSTGYILRVEKVEEVDVPPDPNPNVKRRRILVTYSWIQRQ